MSIQSLHPVALNLKPEDRLAITHGNGPVVGNILLRNAAAAPGIPPMPLDVCVADSQGGIGYMICQSMENVLRANRDPRPVTAVITRIRVDPTDPALARPTKPIGPFYEETEAKGMARRKGWTVVEDSGRGWRQVVGSPRPLEILELEAIRALFEAGHAVVAAGGGGVPVARDARGELTGVEAVIDKDRASALLAKELGIEELLLITGVPYVALDFGKPTQRDLDRITLAEARQYLENGEFGEGSMKPKMEAVITFLEDGGREVRITSPEEIGSALKGSAGTLIVP